MKTEKRECVIIGGGPAGLGAALALCQAGQTVTLLERDDRLGGILNQCIHDGFGLKRFGESLSGPEYAGRYLDELAPYAKKGLLELRCGTMVVRMDAEKRLEISSYGAYGVIKAKTVILAMGCRERPRGAISIPGTRPAGVMTAGVAQRLMNLHNVSVGRRVVILGSGDIGMIMARRFTLEGAKVLAVVEKLPYTSGLQRNVVQCLEDFGIPLLLSHTVTNIWGDEHLEAVEISALDEQGAAIPGSEERWDCDTLVLSVGLIPENELAREAGVALSDATNGAVVDAYRQTSIPGVFACGNTLHVHDLADDVSVEAQRAAEGVLRYLKGEEGHAELETHPGEGVRYVLPQRVAEGEEVTLSLRVSAPGRNRLLLVKSEEGVILRRLPVKRVHPAEMLHLPVRRPTGKALWVENVENDDEEE